MLSTTEKSEADFSIKPEAVAPSLDTSAWPLLLKNYDKCIWPSLQATVPANSLCSTCTDRPFHSNSLRKHPA